MKLSSAVITGLFIQRLEYLMLTVSGFRRRGVPFESRTPCKTKTKEQRKDELRERALWK